MGGAEGAAQGARSWGSPAQCRGILPQEGGQAGRKGALQADGCARWESWLCPLLAEKLSAAEAAWRGGFAILFTDVCIPSTQSSSCSKNIC